MSDMSDNVIQDSNSTLESSPPKLNTQNSANNAIQNYRNNNNNYYNNFQFCYNIPRNNYNSWYNNFYDVGIATYCSITQNNVLILNNLKEKYYKIIIDDIIKKNFKDKYDLKFNFYGSSCTGLSIEGSDSDCCIFFKELIQSNLPFHEELYTLLKENEQKRKDISYELIPIFATKIPRIIVKIDIRNDLKKCPLNNFYQYLSDDDMSYIKIDFTFTKNEEYLLNLNKNVQYVKNKLEIYPQIRPVLLVLKRYFKNFGMNEVFIGGISSYSLFLLVLNSIYIYQKENPNLKITNSQLLIQVFKKFSYFKFDQYGIGKDNNEFILSNKNEAEILYIIDPLSGKNIASVGKCTGKEVKGTFAKGFEKLCLQNNYFIQLFQYNRLFLINSNPIIPIVSLFNK
jgi:DNA polymerase sigma